MRLALKPHPESRPSAVTGIEVDVARPSPTGLRLRYRAGGDVGQLLLPPAAHSHRADDLWKHTCFEVFVRAETGEGYFEFNLSPSTEWAAYRFEGYRAGMAPVGEALAPLIEGRAGDGLYELTAALELDGIEGLDPEAPWRLAIAAVIEEADGEKSYWALAHGPGNPDFHHLDAFAHQLDRP